jgi:hypothetical protein
MIQGFLDIINNLSGLATVPQVLTTSYGEDEPDQTAAAATCVVVTNTALFYEY